MKINKINLAPKTIQLNDIQIGEFFEISNCLFMKCSPTSGAGVPILNMKTGYISYVAHDYGIDVAVSAEVNYEFTRIKTR